MANVVIVGAQWGDEGKGKIIDFLTESSDIVVRAQGAQHADSAARDAVEDGLGVGG